MNRHLLSTGLAILICGAAGAASAATHCVKPGGGSGCYATISAAIIASSPGDTIFVAPGTYAESVVIDRQLTLIGFDMETTIVDASGLSRGINVDGVDNPGLVDHTVVRNFTVKNANNEGILVSNATDVVIAGNHVVHNDLGLVGGACTTVAPPDSPAGEMDDCGEGVHLSGVDHSTVSSNLVEHNAGGILLTDDSGPTHDNLVAGNVVRENAFDCGITLASHTPLSGFGVFRNTVAENESLYNGQSGFGAGIGIFAPAPGNAAYSNVVLHNRAIGNTLPGIALHSHAPGQNLNDNAIIGNYIAGNGADGEDTATPGPTGINIAAGRDGSGNVVGSAITGTIVSHNEIEHESVDIAVSDPMGAEVDAHLNDLEDKDVVGVANLGAGTVNAIENWWGCEQGPMSGRCSSVSGDVAFTPWLSAPVHRDEDDDRGDDQRHGDGHR